MESFPVRDVLGYGEVLWAFSQARRKRRSRGWASVAGVVEAHEFLRAKGNGWFVVLYSYSFDGTHFAGEWRKWYLFFETEESLLSRLTSQLPLGANVRVRVNPDHPEISVAEI